MTTETHVQKTTDRDLFVVTPRVDVYENADEYLVVADLPGVSQEKLDVSFVRGELTLEGVNGGRMYRRVFTLPDGIDGTHVAARLTQGVLQVHLPKAPEVKPRKIEVRTG